MRWLYNPKKGDRWTYDIEKHRYSESAVAFGVCARADMKALEEKVTLLHDENMALEKANLELLSKVEELKDQVKAKD